MRMTDALSEIIFCISIYKKMEENGVFPIQENGRKQ